MTSQAAPCPVCSKSLIVRPAEGRKSGKPFIMLICPEDGRHFRGFITDKDYVGRVHASVKGLGSEDKGT